MNRLASLRLTERCADILISIREEVIDAGRTVAEELHSPITKFSECVHTSFRHINALSRKVGQDPVVSRAVRRLLLGLRDTPWNFPIRVLAVTV